jgi:hypothetical protein
MKVFAVVAALSCALSLAAAVPLPQPAAAVNCECQCEKFTWADASGKEHGNCLSDDGTALWCYTASKTCSDAKTSNAHGETFEARTWSHVACTSPKPTDPRCQHQISKRQEPTTTTEVKPTEVEQEHIPKTTRKPEEHTRQSRETGDELKQTTRKPEEHTRQSRQTGEEGEEPKHTTRKPEEHTRQSRQTGDELKQTTRKPEEHTRQSRQHGEEGEEPKHTTRKPEELQTVRPAHHDVNKRLAAGEVEKPKEEHTDKPTTNKPISKRQALTNSTSTATVTPVRPGQHEVNKRHAAGEDEIETHTKKPQTHDEPETVTKHISKRQVEQDNIPKTTQKSVHTRQHSTLHAEQESGEKNTPKITKRQAEIKPAEVEHDNIPKTTQRSIHTRQHSTLHAEQESGEKNTPKITKRQAEVKPAEVEHDNIPKTTQRSIHTRQHSTPHAEQESGEKNTPKITKRQAEVKPAEVEHDNIPKTTQRSVHTRQSRQILGEEEKPKEEHTGKPAPASPVTGGPPAVHHQQETVGSEDDYYSN